MTLIVREPEQRLNLALTTAIGTTPAIDKGGRAGMRIYIRETMASLTVYDSADGVTYYAAQDETGAACVITVGSGKSFPLPAACFASRFIKLVADQAGHIDASMES